MLNWILISLSIIAFVMILFMVYSRVEEYVFSRDPVLHELRQTLSPVHPIVDDLLFLEGNKSYAINKKKIYMCLYDENHELYAPNTLIFVALHEIAHCINQTVGHDDGFHEVFQELLDTASELGIFNPSIPIPENYCKY